MAAIKTNVYRMNSILLWDEPDSMLICRNRKSLIYKQFYNHRKYFEKEVSYTNDSIILYLI